MMMNYVKLSSLKFEVFTKCKFDIMVNIFAIRYFLKYVKFFAFSGYNPIVKCQLNLEIKKVNFINLK